METICVTALFSSCCIKHKPYLSQEQISRAYNYIFVIRNNIKTFHELNFAPAFHDCIKYVMHAPNKSTQDNLKYI